MDFTAKKKPTPNFSAFDKIRTSTSPRPLPIVPLERTTAKVTFDRAAPAPLRQAKRPFFTKRRRRPRRRWLRLTRSDWASGFRL